MRKNKETCLQVAVSRIQIDSHGLPAHDQNGQDLELIGLFSNLGVHSQNNFKSTVATGLLVFRFPLNSGKNRQCQVTDSSFRNCRTSAFFSGYLQDEGVSQVAAGLIQTQYARLVGTRQRAFSVVAPQLWNSFPREVCLAPDILSLRRL